MNVFSAATPVTVTVPLTDPVGNPLTVDAISYRVIDQAGNELVAMTPLADFSAGSDTAVVTVEAVDNIIAQGAARELREVQLYCIVEGNEITLRTAYAVGDVDSLRVGVNSFMTYPMAEFIALDLPNLDAWNAATEAARMAALQEARSHIAQLSFTPLAGGWGMDSLNYIPEGTYDTNRVGMFEFAGDVSVLGPTQLAALPSRFLMALYKAQVVEANDILGGNTVEQRRQEGLILDVTGESRQGFRPTKPLALPVCRRALGYLSLYISFSKRIGRS